MSGRIGFDRSGLPRPARALVRGGPRPGAARRPAHHRVRRLDRAGVSRPRRDGGARHALHVPLRAPRRAHQAIARQRHGAVPGRGLERERRRAHLRLQAARGAQVSQRRPLHRRRREVQLRAIPRQLGQAAARPGEVGGYHRPAPRAIHAAQALAGLPRLLRHAGHRGGVDRPQEVHREGRRGRIQAAARGARARTASSAWIRARSSCSRPTSSTGGRSPRSSESSSRAFPIGRRAWPC